MGRRCPLPCAVSALVGAGRGGGGEGRRAWHQQLCRVRAEPVSRVYRSGLPIKRKSIHSPVLKKDAVIFTASNGVCRNVLVTTKPLVSLPIKKLLRN